jgi:glucosamine 6-phosphate synthetase-like amidotransferase/phosphosugar isomerase protein
MNAGTQSGPRLAVGITGLGSVGLRLGEQLRVNPNASVVAITDGQTDVDRYADHVLEIPETHPRAAAVLANTHLQLVSYHTAALLGRNIDKPRNLAKSVTVE